MRLGSAFPCKTLVGDSNFQRSVVHLATPLHGI